MASRKRTEEQMQSDLAEVARLMLQSYNIRQITQHINQKNIANGYTLSHVQIFKDSKAIFAQWQEERAEYIDEVVTRELAKIDYMEFEAWQSWNASKKGKSKTTIKGGNLSNGQLVNVNQGDTVRTTESSHGDPRFLMIIQNCWEKRQALLGYGAAVKVEHSGSVMVGSMQMDEEEREKEKQRILKNMLKKNGIQI